MLREVIDSAIDGAYTFTATLLGYFAGQGGALVMPSKAALVLAALTGLGGFLNQWRALRKQPR